jgi:signal transduction histidine kinase
MSVADLPSAVAAADALLARAVDACLLLDANGTIRFANRAAEQSAGVEAGELVGRSGAEFRPGPGRVWRDTALVDPGGAGLTLRILSGAEPAVAVRDPELLLNLLDNLPSGVMAFTSQNPADPGSLTPVYANEAMKTVTRVDMRRFLGQRMDVFARATVERGRAALLAEPLRTGKVRVLPLDYYAANQAVEGMPAAWVETRSFPTGANTVGIIVENVTSRVEHEAERTRMTGALERSNSELERFAYVASHDLQEPLRKIQAFGDRLKAHCAAALDDKGADYLRRMQDAARRMQTLIEDLLTLSRLAATPRAPTEIALDELVANVLRDLETRIEATGASVAHADLPVVFGDRSQLRQVFQNLVGNALKFQPPGQSPRVAITGRAVTTPLPGYELAVEDNGIGIDAKFAERIFEPFQRLHGLTEYPGTGVGLSICARVAALHGGRLTLDTAHSGGSRFVLFLPDRPPTQRDPS